MIFSFEFLAVVGAGSPRPYNIVGKLIIGRKIKQPCYQGGGNGPAVRCSRIPRQQSRSKLRPVTCRPVVAPAVVFLSVLLLALWWSATPTENPMKSATAAIRVGNCKQDTCTTDKLLYGIQRNNLITVNIFQVF